MKWIIESLNANCTLWISGEYACLSVVLNLNTLLCCLRVLVVSTASLLMLLWVVRTCEQKAQLASVFLTLAWNTQKSLLPSSQHTTYNFWPQIRQDYPLNLSILISGGKETNKDSLSNGEWSGKSSSLKSLLLATANCSLRKYCQGNAFVLKLLGTACQRGWEPRLRHKRLLTRYFPRVGLLGNAAQNGR